MDERLKASKHHIKRHFTHTLTHEHTHTHSRASRSAARATRASHLKFIFLLSFSL